MKTDHAIKGFSALKLKMNLSSNACSVHQAQSAKTVLLVLTLMSASLYDHVIQSRDALISRQVSSATLALLVMTVNFIRAFT